MENKTKYTIGITVLSFIVVALIVAIIILVINQNRITGDMEKAIHAIVSTETATLRVDREDIVLSKGERISILKDDIINNEYLVSYNDKTGRIDKNAVSYFEFDDNERYSLMLDVSTFNIVGEESDSNKNRNFQNEKDFELFILENNIQYVYIRLGGRGWGQKGTLYYDDESPRYVEACEYLKVPYGFYYLDEALNDEEVQEEVQFVKKFIDKNKDNMKMNVLPIAIDLEYQSGQGRTDGIWEQRVPILNNLIEEFNKNDMKCIIYANGARVEKYIKDANTEFWVAMYPEENVIPENNYKATIKIEQLENQLTAIVSNNLSTKINKGGTDVTVYSDEFLDKVIGWQFTESGAKYDGIEEYIDLSIVDNKLFKKYIK